MEVEKRNNLAAKEIINYLEANCPEITREITISDIQAVADITKSEYLETDDLIGIIRILIDRGIFVSGEFTDVDINEEEPDIINVSITKSLGSLNLLLQDTDVRVFPTGVNTHICIISAIY
jgi:hypothetical protein